MPTQTIFERLSQNTQNILLRIAPKWSDILKREIDANSLLDGFQQTDLTTMHLKSYSTSLIGEAHKYNKDYSLQNHKKWCYTCYTFSNSMYRSCEINDTDEGKEDRDESLCQYIELFCKHYRESHM